MKYLLAISGATYIGYGLYMLQSIIRVQEVFSRLNFTVEPNFALGYFSICLTLLFGFAQLVVGVASSTSPKLKLIMLCVAILIPTIWFGQYYVRLYQLRHKFNPL